VACYACDRSGAITDFNRRAVELWGREPQPTDRFTGAHRTLDMQGDPLPAEATGAAFLLRCGVAASSQELMIERPNGKRVPVLSSLTPLLDDEGNIVGALNVLQDITDRRRLEEARRVAERLSASARIASDVAQRLQPALLSLVKLLDRLGRDATLSADARAHADQARQELAHFDELVRHMAHISGAA